nr:reverse transcriptase domain-containing protein [Tanacetum cinerariifolium]
MNVFMKIGFGSTIKLVSFDNGQVVTFNGKFVSGFRNSDRKTRSQSDNTVGSPHGFVVHWIIISKNIKEVTEVIDVENWRIDNSRVLRWIVSLIVWNSSASSTKTDVPNDVIKLMMFLYSLEGAARVWYDKEPPNSILTWDDLVNKFVNQFFPPSKTTHLKNEISRFTQRFEETFGEAWERFKEILRSSGGNLLSKTTREALNIIKNKSKVCYLRNKPNVSRMNTTSRENARKMDDRIDKLADQISTLVDIVSKKVVTPATVKAVEESCVTCGSNHSYYNCDATNSNKSSVCAATDLHFDISFVDALLLMPKFASTIKSLLENKDKLFELAKIPLKLFELAKIQLNENCSAMLLKKLPGKLGDPGKFLIPCDFSGMDVCHALVDLGASINLMPLSIWKKLSLPKLTPTRMTLELADRSITRPKGVAKDVFVKVGKFHFLTDFVVIDFEAGPRVPLILGRSFLRTARALIDVYGEEITIWVNDKAVTFNLNQTTRYSCTYDDMLVNRIDVIDVAREEYAQEMLGFSKNSLGGNLTLTSEPIIFDSSPPLTPFKGKGDIFWIEKSLNDDPFQLPLMDLNQREVAKAKSSIEEPPELELKDLPLHLEYAYLEGVNKLPVIIAKDLKDDEKEAPLKVLKSHKQAIAWKITNIKGIDPRFCTHKILMEEDYKPAVQSQRRVNPKIHEVIKKEVIKILDAEMIYSISDSPWVSLIHCVPMKGGITIVENENNELIPTRLVIDCIDAFETLKKKLTEAPILVVPDWNLPFELMCDASNFAIAHKYLLSKQDAKPRLLWWVLLLQEFDIIIRDKKKTDNLAVDHFSRLENPYKDVFENKDINKNFPLETLGKISSESTPWFADFANFYAGNLIVKGMSSQQKKKFFKDVRHYFWYILVAIDYLSKWVEVKALPTNDARVVVKFLKSLFARFETPRAIISDHGTHFCNDKFAKVMFKYGVTHRLATAYHPQTSRQVEVLNCGLKRILERTVEENRASWSEKLEDALWAFRTAYKTPIGCTPYKLVYGKSCHLHIELEHKAYWALKHVNFDLKTAGDHRKLKLNELNELRNQIYENSLIYKEKTKRLHDSKIKNRIFSVGD